MTLVRHGATAWNATGRFQGHADVELSREGREQARAIAALLGTERVDRVYASDLRRAHETARIVAAPHRVGVTQDERLREFAFGQWEGLTWPEIVATRPYLESADTSVADRYAPEGGETFDDVSARIASFLDDLQATGDEHVVVVTHAGPLHAILAVLKDGADELWADPLTTRFSPASVTRIAMEGGRARLISLNDVRHLHSAG